MTAFAYRTQPYEHQREILRRTHNIPGYMLLWEMGVGKTKPTIDLTAFLASKGEVRGALVIAPNGVHTNWHTDELPTHLGMPYTSHAYYVTQAKQEGHEASLRRMLRAEFPILCISVHGLLNDRLLTGTEHRAGFVPTGGLLYDFIKKYKPIVIVDESSMLKNDKGKMSLRARSLTRLAEWVRALEGTPVANGPLDIYAQALLLDERFWVKNRMSTFTAFKNEFAITKPLTGITLKNKNGSPRQGQWAHPTKIVGYKNLDQLYAMLAPHSHRLLKEDVLDLPPKAYQYRYFELSGVQRNTYDTLKKELMVELNGHLITATMPIVKLLRLQQITCNYLPSGEEDETQLVDTKNHPRLDVLRELCEEVPHQSIIWCRFKRDSEFIAGMLSELKRTWVRYDGDSTDKQKSEAVSSFKAGNAQFSIGRTSSGLARGHTLVCAKTVVYYNNTFMLGQRLQSEDRAHRIGQEDPVLYWDLVARNTVDRQITESLKSKFDVAAQITHDRLREWLQ